MYLILFLWINQFTFDQVFTPETMRLDFYHTGTATEEFISLDHVWNDGPWSGPTKVGADQMNLGAYRFEIADTKGNVLFSGGFSSIFGEWQTTSDAKKQYATFPESIRFPWPKSTVKVTLFKRVEDGGFKSIWAHQLEPQNRQNNSAEPQVSGEIRKIVNNGPSMEKVDLVLLSEGFMEIDKEQFFQHATRLSNELFTEEPFTTRMTDFNIWAVFTPSGVSGISKPHHAIYKRSNLECQYSSFDSERYVLTTANKKVRDAASMVPYDFTVILINEETYGGGGIYKLYATCPVHNSRSRYLFIHEFGHHFAALADEYFTSDVAYDVQEKVQHPEPWEPNITSHPSANELKWKHLAAEGIPLPTPWDKDAFEKLGTEIRNKRGQLRASNVSEKDMDDLFSYQAERETELFKKSPYYGQVGAFEGGGYISNGMYRPRIDCMMFSRNPVGFCPVCQEALEKVIDRYTNH